MRVIAVPVKSLERAKGRLAGLLDPVERAAVTLSMLEDVLDACTAIPGWQTWVISPDPAVLQTAVRRRARPVEEEEPGLLTAITQVEEEAAGADALAVLLGDLPLLTPDALGRALRNIGPVVATASHSDAGTNLLLRRPPAAIPARFGTDSFRKHRVAADAAGLPFAHVAVPELAFDLDRPEDLARVLSWPSDRRTRRICLEIGVADRLGVRKRA